MKKTSSAAGQSACKSLLNIAYCMLLVTLVAASIGLHQGVLFGRAIQAVDAEHPAVPALTLTHVQQVFPTATTFKEEPGRVQVFAGQEVIGWGRSTSPDSDSIVGYASAVPVFIGFDPTNHVVGLSLLENAESPDFVKEVVKAGVLKAWTGAALSEMGSVAVDSVTGATMTSKAIIGTVRHSMGAYLEQPVLKISTGWLEHLKVALGWFLLAAGLIQFFAPRVMKPYRVVYQLFVLAVLGFWAGTFLSMSSLYNWTVSGLQLPSRLFMFVILVLSLGLPLLTGRAFYCVSICPYGAAQDLMKKTRKKSVTLPPRLRTFLSTLREKIFALVIVLLLSGVSFDLAQIEPFAAFLFRAASLPVLLLAVLFLVLAIFVPRAWCRFACPTGHFLELIRTAK